MSIFTIYNSNYFAQPFVQYTPLTAGYGLEPTTSICTMIRNTFLSAPMTWYFNRNEITFQTVVGQQDYPQSFSANGNDFGFIETVQLTDDQGKIWNVKDVYNTSALPPSTSQARPNAVSVKSVTYSGSGNTQSVAFRFLGVPDQVYTVTVTYQKLAPLFGPFIVSAAGNASAGNTAYTGVFDPYSLPTNGSVVISGFATAANNGTFVIVSCTTTTLTVANGSGTAQSANAFAVNPSWAPLPDQFSDIYNNLFLSEVLAVNDDQPRAQLYRQRGMAAFLSKSTGLTEMQKNAFIQQWLARDVERNSVAQTTQQGNLGRSV